MADYIFPLEYHTRHMKIIFLNTLGGKVQDGITNYIANAASDTDIFCFQETYEPMRIICRDILPDWREINAHKDINNDDFSLATYFKKDIGVVSSKTLFETGQDAGLGIYTEVRLGDKIIHICNFHGLSKPGDKLDNPDRIKQSERLLKFFEQKDGLKIIGGDFNLLPETKSVRMFGEYGYKDLIHEFKIPTTRNRLTWELHPGTKQYYSDYIFVSPDVRVTDFSVPNIEISDHLPLILSVDL